MKLVLALLLLTLAMAPAFMASPAYAQIEIVEADPPDGSELDEPPDVVHLCFSQPVKYRDSASFNFRYLMPDDRALGMRIVFGLGGECVDIFPGLPAVRPEGEYSFEWQVAAAEGDEVGSGTLHFMVGETPEAAGADDDDGPDILLLALITIAGVGGAAVLFTLGYFVRRRIGYDPHRPPEGDEGGDDH